MPSGWTSLLGPADDDVLLDGCPTSMPRGGDGQTISVGRRSEYLIVVELKYAWPVRASHVSDTHKLRTTYNRRWYTTQYEYYIITLIIDMCTCRRVDGVRAASCVCAYIIIWNKIMVVTHIVTYSLSDTSAYRGEHYYREHVRITISFRRIPTYFLLGCIIRNCIVVGRSGSCSRSDNMVSFTIGVRDNPFSTVFLKIWKLS